MHGKRLNAESEIGGSERTHEPDVLPFQHEALRVLFHGSLTYAR